MGNFNRGGGYNKPSFSSNRGEGGGGFKRRDFNDRSSRGPVEMHDAVCDNCGKNCQVPFRPTSGKPVFCSDCFENKNSGSESRRFEGRSSGRSSFEEKQMFNAVCDNCGKDCKVPFKPSGDKPVYCNSCFESKNGGGSREQSSYNQQFEALNKKLDNILRILESATSEEVPPKVSGQPVEEQVTPKVEKKKKTPRKVAKDTISKE